MDIREERYPREQPGGRRSIRELLEQLNENVELKDKKEDTLLKGRKWRVPFRWKSKMKKASRMKDKVLVFYLNIKGEFEQPMIVPIYSGNMIIIKNKPHEIDPRAFWMVRVGFKQYKVMIVKEIDRRPVSNLDYSEIKKRGDATDSDEFLIKAALKAQQAQVTKGMGKIVIIIIIIAIVGAVLYFFLSK